MLTLSMLATASVLACGPRVDPPPAGAGLSTAHLALGNVPGVENFLLSFDLLSGTFARVGPGGLPPGLVYAAATSDCDGARLFYASRDTTGSAWLLTTVDAKTGAGSSVPLASSPLFLAHDSKDDMLYGLAGVPGSDNELVKIDPRTGRTTRVGSTRLPGGLSGVAAAADVEGERLFYVADNGALVTVDLTTGTALKTNQVAPSQLVLALMFDGASQELVGIGDPFEGRDQLVRINPGTGASVFVGPGRLPFGLWSAAAAFDAEHSLFFYIAADRNDGVDARTGTIVRSLTPPANILALR